MKQPKVQVLGICRWSFPSASDDFRLTPEDLDAKRAMLYAQHRLEHRLFLLEEVVLPSLRRQTDQDFTLLLLMGDSLPEPYKERILDLVRLVSQVKPIFAKEGQPQQDLVRELLTAERDPDADAVAEFRLDDDDAVAVDFVEESRRVYADIRPFYERTGLFGVDYTRGLVMRTTPEKCDFLPIIARWWAPGMVIYIKPGTPNSVLDYHHMRVWHEMHMLMFAEKAMFLRGVHHSNDSSIEKVGRRTGRYPLPRQEKRQFVLDRFGIDMRRICRVWKRRAPEFLGEAHQEPAPSQ